jgi:hypothetical protein
LLLTGTASAVAAPTPVIRTNYFHGSMCQGPTSGSVTYADNGARATVNTSFVCPAPWSVDMAVTASAPQPLQKFWFKAYWTNIGLAAPSCTLVINTTTSGLSIVGSPHQTVDQTNPTTNTASSSAQSNPGGIIVDVRRAYMLCIGVVSNAGIDGYTLSTCFGQAGDCPS